MTFSHIIIIAIMSCLMAMLLFVPLANKYFKEPEYGFALAFFTFIAILIILGFCKVISKLKRKEKKR